MRTIQSKKIRELDANPQDIDDREFSRTFELEPLSINYMREIER